MWKYRQWFVVSLWLMHCTYSKAEREQQQKTIRKDAVFTPVCSNSTQNLIIYVNCKIKPAGSREEECHLTFQHIRGFEQKCDSRFSLLLLNQTIFLELKNLTPENIGNYTCQCSKQSGTFTLELNITVEDDEDATPPTETTSSTNLLNLIAVFVLIAIILLGVISGCISMNKRHRRRLRREMTITTLPNTEIQNNDADSLFKDNELYLTSIIRTSASTNNLIVVRMDNTSFGSPL